MKKNYRIIIPLSSALLILVLLFSYMIKITPSDKLIEVKKGDTFYSISKTLVRSRIIKSGNLFILLVKLSGRSRHLKTGVYQFNTGSLFDMIRSLTKGHTASKAVTIPEGYNIYRISELLEKKGITDNKNFLKAARDPELLKEFNINLITAEGFLYPDTYHLPYGIKAGEIVRIMVKNFFNHIHRSYLEKIKNKYSSIKKAVILASLVEWEAKSDFERPIIAGVFLNRIKKNMNLQSCATVLYTLSRHKSRLLFKDLKVKSPYNTYLYKGLPPTPICSPSEKSILAVIYPIKTDYLYFVSMQNGRHYFSSTYKQHRKAYKYFILNERSSNPFIY